ncbi:phage tail tape measure protein [Flagellimonas nanhaiensis]|uniref:Phage tail tape measure protein n=1 Tax=Flagellimonas nanhaiensis TaxID=2292706 RepID=A0A371JL86_9FLAO|nr:phage tail tape measure protein [Allomuricauda nanhaiensis]RDY57713.1 phage tail tape measure protein [Allomuricauda nanhaiensis]
MGFALKIPAQFTAIDKFSHVLGKMGKATKNFSKIGVASVQRFDKKVTAVFNKMGRLTRLVLGIGIGTLFLNATGDIKTFETNLVGVGKTTGLQGKVLKQLGQDTIAASNAMRGIKTNKLLELGGVAGQLGISGSEDILRFSSTMAKLEKASDIQGEEGAASIARLLNITGEGPKVVDRFSASLVGLGNTSAATESEILSVANEVARSTAAYKLNLKEILGMSAALANMGVSPEAAGSAIGKTFIGIEKATLKGGEKLRNYAKVMGITSKEVKTLFASDKQAAFNKLLEGLNKIGKEGGSITKAMNDLGIADTRVLKGIIPLATNYNTLQAKMKLANNEFEKNTALNNEFNTASKTVQTALDDIAKRFTNVLLKTSTTGTGLERVQNILFFVADNMETIVVVGASLVGMFGLMKAIVWGSQIAMVAYNVALGIHGALQGAASINIGKSAVALGAYKVAMGISTAVTWLATTATTAFGVALNVGLWPILAIIAAIAALIAVFYYWDDITAWFGKQWKRFTNWIGNAWDSVVSWFKEFDFKAFFMQIGQSILKFLLTPMRMMLRLASKIPGKIGDMAKGALDKLGNLTGEGEIKVKDAREPLDSPELNNSKITHETIQKSRVDLTVRDDGNNIENIEASGPNAPNIIIPHTQGAS